MSHASPLVNLLLASVLLGFAMYHSLRLVTLYVCVQEGPSSIRHLAPEAKVESHVKFASFFTAAALVNIVIGWWRL